MQFAAGEDAQVLGRARPANAAGGVPVVPTEWSDPGEPVDLPAGEFVVKPSHDVVPAPGGSVVLGLFERSLILQYDQDAAVRFAAAASRRL